MPTPEEIVRVALRELADVAEVDEDRLTPDATLEDLDIDLLDLVELGQIIEKRFSVEFDRNAMNDVKTVDEACRVLIAQVTHPSLADHVTGEDVLLPGFFESALAAGPHVDELTQLAPPHRDMTDELLRLEWSAPEPAEPGTGREVEFVEAATAADALVRVQAWLAHEREGVLAFMTRGAVATAAGEDVTDRAGSAVWGLVRSAQTEHPGRFALVDLDAGASADETAAELIAAGEEQLAIRNAAALVPGLTRGRDEDALTVPAGDWRQLDLAKLVATNTALVLGHAEPGSIRAEQSFKSLGFDSLTAVELCNRLSLATGLRLPATVLFDYPTPARLIALLREQLNPQSEQEPQLETPAGADVGERIDAASADELLALIDNDLAA